MVRRRVLRSLFVLLMSLLIWADTGYAETAPTTRRELIQRVRDAVESHDADAFKQLYLWEDVEPDIRKLHEDMLTSMLQNTVESIEFVPVSPDYESDFEEDGVKYTINLPVEGLIKIRIFDDIVERIATIKIPYGQKGNAFYLAGIMRETPRNESRYNVYTISVQGLLFPDPVEFKGIYQYEKDGQLVKKKFKSSGFYKDTFEADRLNACIIQKSSDFGWVKLFIKKNKEWIYKSKETDAAEPIVYKAPK